MCVAAAFVKKPQEKENGSLHEEWPSYGKGLKWDQGGVVSRSALGKQKVYYPRVSAEAEDVRYTIQGFRVLIKNDFEV